MARFRKKPVTIEAVPVDQVIALRDLPSWVKEALTCEIVRVEGKAIWVSTLEGKMRGEPSAWLIKGVKGELYCCDAEIFAQTYEPIVERPLDASAQCDQVMKKLQVTIEQWDTGRSAKALSIQGQLNDTGLGDLE